AASSWVGSRRAQWSLPRRESRRRPPGRASWRPHELIHIQEPVGSLTTGFSKEIRAAVSDRGSGVRGRVRGRPRGRPNEKGTAIMKLTTMTQVTVDGVMQGNGGASDEDRRNGFERGGWAMGVADNETMTFINQTYQRADAFLFGRRTYELFAGYWGAEERARAAAEDPGNPPIADALNTKPKYLASTTLTDPQWADTTVLSGDLAAAIGELKATPGGELQVNGSGALIRWLLEN